MLFDDDEQLEVRHVISLAHHTVGIYSGGDVTPEGELFIKRNALCLTRKENNGTGNAAAPDAHQQVSKPFYLFSENCSVKEDFYFALLKSQEQTFGFDDTCPPIPKGFEVRNIISLVQRLHASEDHVHSRWLNALLGRIFLAVYRTRDLENYIREKLTKKIARVKRPSFLANITIQKIDTGEAAPFFTNLKLKDLTVEGECVVEADVRYTGNFRIEVGATAKIDLGARFKAREVTLLLAVVLKRLEGHVLFKVKAPPSNRLWLSFRSMPKMEMVIEPIVSTRQITYTLILRQIENRIKEVLAETLVQPYWDDVPFFKTEHKIWRGGIFQGDDAVESTDVPDTVDPRPVAETADKIRQDADATNQTRPLEKSHTLPATGQPQPAAGLFGRKQAKDSSASLASVSPTATQLPKDASTDLAPGSSTGTDAQPLAAAGLFGRKQPKDASTGPASVSSTGTDGHPLSASGLFGRKLPKDASTGPASVSSTSIDANLASPRSSVPRSLSIVRNSTGPIVGTETAHADLFKPSSSPPDHASTLMASLASRSHDASPLHTPFGSPAKAPPPNRMSRGSSVSSREVDDKAKLAGADLTPVATNRRNTASSADSFPHSDGSVPSSPAQSAPGSFHSQTGGSLGKSFFSRRDTASTTASSESSAGGELKKTTLAAVTNAAEQARQWGWNAIRRHKDARLNGEIDLTQPMGRGQPLPPPGTPLPGPANGASRLGLSVAAKRKPTTAPMSPAVENMAAKVAEEDGDAGAAGAAAPPPLQSPALPHQRTRRAAKQQRSEELGQNMLVVAAPDDSQPATPSADEKASYDEDWANTATGDAEHVAVLTPGTRPTSEVLLSPVPELQAVPPSSSLSGGVAKLPDELAITDAKGGGGAKGSPLVAAPAAMADAEDEDDFSCWLEDDGPELDQALETTKSHQLVATSENPKIP